MQTKPSAMRGQATLKVERTDRPGGDRLSVLSARTPLALRPINPKGPEPLTHKRRDVARVALAASAAGPLGGDQFTLSVHVGAGATLVFNEIAAMLVLPGPHGHASSMQIDIHVASGGTLVWLPEIVIAAAGCNHAHRVNVQMDAGSRGVFAEETLLGRHNEQPGNIASTLRVAYDRMPLYHQTLHLGPDAGQWRSAAVVGPNKAFGSIVVVEPDWTEQRPATEAYDANAILAPMPGPGLVISAVAEDSLALKRRLFAGLDRLGAPWAC